VHPALLLGFTRALLPAEQADRLEFEAMELVAVATIGDVVRGL